jgi:alkylation response protein AidB-like acyl-CoA dehydrogenase
MVKTIPSVDEFLTEAEAWLQTVASPKQQVAYGEGSDSVAIFENWTPEEERAQTNVIRAYEQKKFDAGFGPLTWPEEYGGRGLPMAHQLAFRQLEETYDVPRRTEMFPVTQQLVAPTVETWGTPEQKEKFLRAMLRTDLIVCQLFSETEAGSDLAAVRTKAVQEGDQWRLDGHKVWTSGARVADYGIAVCRTNPNVSKHAGLTVFLVPMDAPGVTVRPIRQMTGGTSFNEVYLDSVVVSDELRLGPVDAGWKVALTVLGNERLDSGILGLGNADRLVDLATNLPADLDQVQRHEVAEVVIRSWVQRVTNMRVAAAVVAGKDPGAEASVGKLLATSTMSQTSEAVRALLASEIALRNNTWDRWAWTEHVLGAPGYRIAGGTDEIQHNIIAERLLGMPKEPKP